MFELVEHPPGTSRLLETGSGDRPQATAPILVSTDLPTFAPQRFRPLLEDELTVSRRPAKTAPDPNRPSTNKQNARWRLQLCPTEADMKDGSPRLRNKEQ